MSETNGFHSIGVKGVEAGPHIDPEVFAKIEKIRFPDSWNSWGKNPLPRDHSDIKNRHKRIKALVTPLIEELPGSADQWSVNSGLLYAGQVSFGREWHQEDPDEPEEWHYLGFNILGTRAVAVMSDDGLSALDEDVSKNVPLTEYLSLHGLAPESKVRELGGIVLPLAPRRWHRMRNDVWHRAQPNPFDSDIDRTLIGSA